VREQIFLLSWVLAVVVFVTGCHPASDSSTVESADKQVLTGEDYARAERFFHWNADKYIANAAVRHQWIGETDSFWYQRKTVSGDKAFLQVEASTGHQQPAFDHQLIAAELKRLGETDVDSNHLPFDSFSYNADQDIEFQVADKSYRCSEKACETMDVPASPVKPWETPSPDGKWAIYFKDHNLWMRALDGSEDFALTTDGVEDNTYGISTGNDLSQISRQRMGLIDPPLVSWSPDSTKILTQRIDQRQVEMLHLLQYAPEDGNSRPKLYSYRYAMALDEVKPMASFVLIDIKKRGLQKVDYPPIALAYVPHIMVRDAWWQVDGNSFYFVHRKNYGKGYSIHRADSETGAVHKLVDRPADGLTFPGPSMAMPAMVRSLADGGLVWYSDKSGWGHLYYRDPLSGESQQLTSGKWPVLDIVRVDEESGRVFFIRGKPESEGNPYFSYLASVKLDGSDLQLLTPDTANHQVHTQSFSPSGKYFIDHYSSLDNPGIAAVRSSDGQLVAKLQQADISALEKSGFVKPESFQVLAADGKTRLWGTLHKPSNFDPKKSYPIIDSIYPGPQASRVPHGLSEAVFDGYGAQVMAELGFIVITVDGRGTPGRSRGFHYDSDGSLLDKAGYLEDHVTTLKQLASTRSWMDIDRVGIYGNSGGGYASAHAMLRYPDFFKVGVSTSGNHEQRAYLPLWSENYLGEDNGENYTAASNPDLAANLKGKLFIIHGAMDDNVHPGHSLQLVDALIKANKDFDLLILPNASHSFQMERFYFNRRLWDYFVRHLLGATPPANYQFSGMKQG
jgi:dipeptidyl-peptidase 4